MKQDFRNVTLRQLRVLAAVVRSGSVTAAAQRLNVSPPAITLQMQLLQDQARLPLIVRSAAGTVATDAGAEILRTIDQIETLLEDCNAALASIAGSHRGSVSRSGWSAPPNISRRGFWAILCASILGWSCAWSSATAPI